MHEFAKTVTEHLSIFIEILAAAVIGVALVKFLYSYTLNAFQPAPETTNQDLRIRFGSALTIALELLLGADILATAIAPTWDEIGKLAAIAVLRTALNYFLERELKNSKMEKMREKGGTVASTTYSVRDED